MAFDPTPTNLIAGWSEDGTDITFPIASVPELTAAEADAVTGDSRKIMYALLERFYAWQEALPTADRSGKFEIRRSSSINNTTGEIVKVYNITAYLEAQSIDVEDEDP